MIGVIVYSNLYLKPSIYQSSVDNFHVLAQTIGHESSAHNIQSQDAILFLSESTTLHDWIESNETNKDDFNHTLSIFESYGLKLDNIAQIRYLNSTGYERIRYNIPLNRLNNEIKLVSDETLQYKGNRDYFMEASDLDPGEVYISHINLNIENKIIEYVNGNVVPVIRYAAPVYIKNIYSGIVVLNFYYEPIYSRELAFAQEFYENIDVAIIDNNGFFLFSSFNEGWSAKENLNTNITFNDYFGEVSIKQYELDFYEVKISNHISVLHDIAMEFSDHQFSISTFLSIELNELTKDVDRTINLFYILIFSIVLISIPILYFMTIRTLHGIKPICSKCKKIRDLRGNWIQIEKYISDQSGVKFSHSYCPQCFAEELLDIENS